MCITGWSHYKLCICIVHIAYCRVGVVIICLRISLEPGDLATTLREALSSSLYGSATAPADQVYCRQWNVIKQVNNYKQIEQID